MLKFPKIIIKYGCHGNIELLTDDGLLGIAGVVLVTGGGFEVLLLVLLFCGVVVVVVVFDCP